MEHFSVNIEIHLIYFKKKETMGLSAEKKNQKQCLACLEVKKQIMKVQKNRICANIKKKNDMFVCDSRRLEHLSAKNRSNRTFVSRKKKNKCNVCSVVVIFISS